MLRYLLIFIAIIGLIAFWAMQVRNPAATGFSTVVNNSTVTINDGTFRIADAGVNTSGTFNLASATSILSFQNNWDQNGGTITGLGTVESEPGVSGEFNLNGGLFTPAVFNVATPARRPFRPGGGNRAGEPRDLTRMRRPPQLDGSAGSGGRRCRDRGRTRLVPRRRCRGENR